MYVISYFNESRGEWSGTGTGRFDTAEDARVRMRELSDECDRTVSFKVSTLSEILAWLPTAEFIG